MSLTTGTEYQFSLDIKECRKKCESALKEAGLTNVQAKLIAPRAWEEKKATNERVGISGNILWKQKDQLRDALLPILERYPERIVYKLYPKGTTPQPTDTVDVLWGDGL